MAATAWVLGLHLLTMHSNHSLEAMTPGVYLRAPSGITVGVLRNSYERTSAYAGYTFETDDQRFALTVGAITGYPAARVMPVVAPSVRIPLGDSSAAPALRLSFLPKTPKAGTGVALHAGVELSF